MGQDSYFSVRQVEPFAPPFRYFFFQKIQVDLFLNSRNASIPISFCTPPSLRCRRNIRAFHFPPSFLAMKQKTVMSPPSPSDDSNLKEHGVQSSSPPSPLEVRKGSPTLPGFLSPSPSLRRRATTSLRTARKRVRQGDGPQFPVFSPSIRDGVRRGDCFLLLFFRSAANKAADEAFTTSFFFFVPSCFLVRDEWVGVGYLFSSRIIGAFPP